MLLVFHLDPLTESTEKLMLEGTVSSVHQIDRAGGFVPVPRNAFRDLASRHTPDTSGYTARTVLWHKQRAALADGEFDLLFHLDQLFRKAPDDPWAYGRRAQMRTDGDEIEGAIEDYSSLVRLGQRDPATFRARGDLYAAAARWAEAGRDFKQTLANANSEDWYKYGLTSALAGDHEGAGRACREMLARFVPAATAEHAVDEWNDLFRTGLLCILEPRAVADWSGLAGRIEPWVSEGADVSRSALLLRGAIAFRTGNHAAALQDLQRSKLAPATTFLLSGVHLALERRPDAERLLAEGTAVLGRDQDVARRYVGWYGEPVWALLAAEMKRLAETR